MAFSSGNKGGPQNEINVTPLVDVVLVLLIIFMVITPLTPKGLESLVPQPPPPNQPPQPENIRTVVIQVEKESPNPASKVKLKINQEDTTEEKLGPRLEEIFKTRAERVVFVKGDPDVEFQYVARAIDIAKGAGLEIGRAHV